MAYRLLKNAGCLPPELELRKAIVDAEQRRVAAEDADDHGRARRRLLELWRRLSVSRRGTTNLHLEA